MTTTTVSPKSQIIQQVSSGNKGVSGSRDSSLAGPVPIYQVRWTGVSQHLWTTEIYGDTTGPISTSFFLLTDCFLFFKNKNKKTNEFLPLLTYYRTQSVSDISIIMHMRRCAECLTTVGQRKTATRSVLWIPAGCLGQTIPLCPVRCCLSLQSKLLDPSGCLNTTEGKIIA